MPHWIYMDRYPLRTKTVFTAFLVITLLNVAPRDARACSVMPEKLARPHSDVVRSAKHIFLAKVEQRIARSRAPRWWPLEWWPFDAGERTSVTYQLRVIKNLKGESAGVVELEGEGDLSGIWDSTLSDHRDKEFWEFASGRMGIRGDCSMVAPLFVVGATYLVILGGGPDTKQFERVSVYEDKWLQFVAKETKTALPTGPVK